VGSPVCRRIGAELASSSGSWRKWNLFQLEWNPSTPLEIPGDNVSMNRPMPMELVNAIGKCTVAQSATGLCGETRRRLPITRFLAMLALMIVAAWSLEGCGGGNTITVTSVAITPTTITVPLNTTTTFTAVVNLADSTISTTTTITWEVNGISGGELATVGSIVPSADNQLVGVYTAPGTVPTTSTTGVTQVGQVSITAVASQPATSTTSTSTVPTVTSNVAIVTVGAGTGLTVSPTSPTVAANQVQPFTALLNGLTDLDATWTVTPSGNAGVYGSIDSRGNYTAPLSPPPGGTVTITATDPAAAAPATAVVTVVYSDASLTGQYAFSYTGNDSAGYLAVAGSFATNGKGTILSGVEDVDSFLTGVTKQESISGFYTVGPDGRGSANVSSSQGAHVWRFALTTNAHAQLILFDANATGGGTIDQQSLNALSNSSSVITGSYVFNVLGADTEFNPLGLAGKFSADGAGDIPDAGEPHTILDVNDNGIAGGVVTTGNTSLTGSYEFDPLFPGTGRGTLTLTSGPTGAREYAFYAVEGPSASVTHMHLLEIDLKAFVAGDMFSAPAGSTPLTAGNYVFTGGGDTLTGSSVLAAFATGGVFTSNGTAGISGGIFDANVGGTYNTGPAINSCSSYATDANTGRIDLKLFSGTGACPSGPNSSADEFAVYQTSQGTALMLEIDSNALSTGAAYQQCVPPAAACSASDALLSGSFAIGSTGQGVFHDSASSSQPDASGQMTFSGTGFTSGNLDINTFSSVAQTDPIAATGNSFGAPASNGRGTAVLVTTSPAATFNLIYYLIDDNTALFLDQDPTPIATGIIARQF
jgi:hypothetical protein